MRGKLELSGPVGFLFSNMKVQSYFIFRNKNILNPFLFNYKYKCGNVRIYSDEALTRDEIIERDIELTEKCELECFSIKTRAECAKIAEKFSRSKLHRG